MFPPLLYLILLFGLLLRFPLGVCPLPVLVLKERLYLRKQDAGKGLYEQEAESILLTLLHLGIKNIRLGPTLPAFVSPNVLNYLVENFNIAPITTPEEDLKVLLKH